MKIIKNIIYIFTVLIKNIYKIIDKLIVIPLTKIILIFGDRFSGKGGSVERWLTKKNTLLFISLFLSILLFLYVDNDKSTIINNNAEVLYDQKVEVTYNNNAYVVEGLPKSVDVTLIGRRVDLYLAKQLSTGAVTADLSNLEKGTHTIKLNYNSAINSVEYKLNPSSVNVTIYPKISQARTANIDIINSKALDKKLSITDVSLDTKEIIIKGAEHILNDVATVKALVDVKKIVKPEKGVISLDDIRLVAYNEKGNVVKNIEMEPKKISAKVTIDSPSKELPIKVIPNGNPEFGKAIDSITTNITKVKVYGNTDILDKMDYMPVEVDVSNLNSNKTYNVIINKPSGVKEISDTNISVTINVGTETSKEISDISIETINLKEGYKAVAVGENSSKTKVSIKGTKSVLDNIDSTNVKAQVDLENYTEGEYDVNVIVIGEDLRATYTPKTTKIKVKITKK